MTTGGNPGLGWLSSIRGRLFIGLALCGLVPVAVIALTNQTIIASSIEESAMTSIPVRKFSLHVWPFATEQLPAVIVKKRRNGLVSDPTVLGSFAQS